LSRQCDGRGAGGGMGDTPQIGQRGSEGCIGTLWDGEMDEVERA
jgi:hypothetical protein